MDVVVPQTGIETSVYTTQKRFCHRDGAYVSGNQKALDILKTLLYFNTRYHKKDYFLERTIRYV